MTTERVRLNDAPRVARVRLHDTPKAKGRRAKAAARYMAFTEARVAGLRPKAKAYLTWDRNDPDAKKQESVAGLAVLTQPSGVRSYYAHFNLPNQPARSIVLGRVGEMALEEARERTREIRKKAKDGIDPRAGDSLEARIAALEELLAQLKGEKQMAELEVAQRVTFSQLVDAWHKEALAENKSAREVRSLVHYHTKAWAARPALKITKKDVKALLDGIKEGTGDTVRRAQAPTANRLFAHLHTLFAWAVEEEKAGIAASPMRGVKLPSEQAAKPRQRSWFSEGEADAVVVALWGLAGTLGGDSEKFLASSGSRVGSFHSIEPRGTGCAVA